MPVDPASPAGPPAGPQLADPDHPAPEPGRFAAQLALQLRQRPAATPAVPSGSRLTTLGDMVAARAGTPSGLGASSPVGSGLGLGALENLRPAGPSTLAAPRRQASSVGEQVVEAARQYLGVPYKWGGSDPSKGLDCSGLTQRVYREFGVELPRFSGDQARAGAPVASLDEARPGDLVFWNAGGRSRTNHLGIYVGDGQMLHAPRSGDVVKIGPMTRGTPHEIRRLL